MSRISAVFKPNHKALIAYVTAGYPDISATPRVVSLLAENGCDIIELGIPFSDPLADGATIQKASHLALQNGITPQACLDLAAALRRNVPVPLVFMTYYNPVMNFGLENFCQGCTRAGINGLIVPDLPPEEGVDLETITREHDLDLIYLLAPNSTTERINTVAEKSRGFIYLVSLTGVTGARDTLSAGLEDFIKRVRQRAKQPLCVGFGVATSEHAQRIGAFADGIIVGSRIIDLINEDESLSSLQDFISSLRAALDN